MKGTVEDIPVMVILLVVFGFVVSISLLLVVELDTAFSSLETPANESVEGVFDNTEEGMIYLSSLALFVFIGFGLASIIAAYYIDTHPLFMVFSLLMFGISIFVSWILGGVYIEFMSTSTMLSIASDVQVMILMFQNLHIISLAFGVGIIIALYGKGRSPYG